MSISSFSNRCFDRDNINQEVIRATIEFWNSQRENPGLTPFDDPSRLSHALARGGRLFVRERDGTFVATFLLEDGFFLVLRRDYATDDTHFLALWEFLRDTLLREVGDRPQPVRIQCLGDDGSEQVRRLTEQALFTRVNGCRMFAFNIS